MSGCTAMGGRLAVVAVIALVSAACGEVADRRLSLRVRGVNHGAEPDRVHGSKLSGGVVLYSALLRIGAVTLRRDGDPIRFDESRNVDLFETTTLLDGSIPGAPVDALEIEVPKPAKDGVLPGEPVSVFAAGLFGDEVVEYRDVAMDPITLPVNAGEVAASPSLVIEIDLYGWFDEVDEEELAGAQQPPYHIDTTATAEIAGRIEAAIRGSIRVRMMSDDVGKVDTCEGCTEE